MLMLGYVTLECMFTINSYSAQLYLFDVCDPQNLQTKKDHRSTSLEPNKEGHVQGHVTSTYEVTLKGFNILVCLFKILDQKTCETVKSLL